MSFSLRRLTRVVQVGLQIFGAFALLYVLIFGLPKSDSSVAVDAPALRPAPIPLTAPPPPPPVSGCSAEQLAEGRNLLAAYVASIEKPGARFRHGFTAIEYITFPCTRVDEAANSRTVRCDCAGWDRV